MTPWVAALDEKYQDTVTSMDRALRACPDELWNASLWPVHGVERVGGGVVDLPAEERVQPLSAVWNIAYHAIFHLDFNLSRAAGEAPFECPPPFRVDDHERLPDAPVPVLPSRIYTRDELLGYLDYCRRKAGQILPSLTEEELASLVPRRPLAERLLDNLLHVSEHVTQIQMFLGQRRADR
jgi:hypothetical protein